MKSALSFLERWKNKIYMHINNKEQLRFPLSLMTSMTRDQPGVSLQIMRVNFGDHRPV